MALSGLDIYKLLPKTNCKKCGFPTCLAFALALAKKSIELAKCPFVTDEAKAALAQAAQPPIKLITLGQGDDQVKVGNETVMFRHDEKFHNPAVIGLVLNDDAGEEQRGQFLRDLKSMNFERIGERLAVAAVGIKDVSGDPLVFANAVEFVRKNCSQAVVLITRSADLVKAAAEAVKGTKALIFAANEQNVEQLALIAKENNFALVLQANDLETLSRLSVKAAEICPDLMLSLETESLSEMIEEQTQMRRLALKKRFKPFGYPVVNLIKKQPNGQDILAAGALLIKYSSIILLEQAQVGQVLALLTLRQNIYSDPQKPLQVEPKIYPVGSPDEKSPLLVTTNFSLSYFTVLSEVEASKVSSFILSVDTEGMSVLTAWAAEKFTPEAIAKAVNSLKADQFVNHKKLIIPGYVAVMSADLEEQSGWQVSVGPREASGISSFLKNYNQ